MLSKCKNIINNYIYTDNNINNENNVYERVKYNNIIMFQGSNNSSGSFSDFEGDTSSTIHDHIKEDEDFINKYEIIDIIYDKFYKMAITAKGRDDNITYFLKLRSNDIFSHRGEKNRRSGEYDVYKKIKNIKSTYLLKYIDYCEAEKFDYLVIEYCSYNTLSKFLEDHRGNTKKLSDDIIKNIFFRIAKGTQFIHSLNIIHCDLKPDNILINSKTLDLKIVDFDLAKICGKGEFNASNCFGTMSFIAPESHDLYIYSFKTDIWQLGIILYFMTTGKYPFPQISSEYSDDCLERWNTFKYPNLEPLKNIDNDIVRIIKKLLQFKDFERISLEELLEEHTK